MMQRDKIVARMRANPRDWRIDDLKHVANRFGIECRNDGESHHVFTFPELDEDLSVPARRPVKPYYVKRFIALIDRVAEVRS